MDKSKKRRASPFFFAALLRLVASAEALVARFAGVAAALRFDLDPRKLTVRAAHVVAAACYTAANGLASSLHFGHLLNPPLHWLALVCAAERRPCRKIFQINKRRQKPPFF